jgi:hypothetical protein
MEQRPARAGRSPTIVSVHTIPITINPTLASSAEERAAFPNEQERMDQMAASALLHELIHARLKMGFAPGDSDWFAVSPIIADFGKMQARVSRAATERDQVRTDTLALVLIAENVVGSTILETSRRAGFLRETIDHLAEEKFAKQTAGRAFGLSASIANKEIADAYGDQVERTIRGMAPSINTLGNNPRFGSQIQTLKAAIKTFFDKLDALAAADAAAAAASTANAGQGAPPPAQSSSPSPAGP